MLNKAFPMESLRFICFQAIKDNNTAEFHAALLETKKTWNTVMNSKLIRQLSWLSSVSFYCILYNRPNMIAFLREVFTEDAVLCIRRLHHGKGDSLVMQLAVALDQTDCVRELQMLLASDKAVTKENEGPECDIRTAILEMDKQFEIYDDTFKKCFTKLCSKGFDVNRKGRGNRTVLHEAVMLETSYSKIEALFEIGCDVNATDKFGYTPLEILLNKAPRVNFKSIYKPPGDYVNIVRLFLFENPSVCLTHNVTSKVLDFDRRLHKAHFQDAENCPDIKQLKLVPHFHQHGYDFSVFAADFKAQPCFDLVEQVWQTPRKLREVCRITLRQHFTGRAIHSFVESAKIPKSIKEYILMHEFYMTPPGTHNKDA